MADGVGRSDIWKVRPDPESIWRCPCGREDAYKRIVSHRKGWKKRPECNGRIYPASDDLAQDAPNAEPFIAPDDLAALTDAWASDLASTDTGQDEGAPDAADDLSTEAIEALARRLNERKSQGSTAEPAVDLGDLPYNLGLSEHRLDDGEFFLENPPDSAAVSQAREVVSLPTILRVYYDHFKTLGWKVGDGSFSAWVADFLLAHLTECLGLSIAVFNRSEVGFDGPVSQGLQPTSGG